MKHLIVLFILFSRLNSNAFDLGGGDISGMLGVLKEQLVQLQQISHAIGDASKITTADAVEKVLGELDVKLPTQIVELWETADGLRAIKETAGGLYSEIQSTIKLWDGSVMERSLEAYKPLDALQQAVKNSIQVSTKNDLAKQTLQVEHELVQKAALAAPITEVLRLQVVSSGLEARMLRLSLEELAAQQKALLQMAANKAAEEARELASREEDNANVSAIPKLLNRVFPVFEESQPE